jgi:hypothetical protein
MMLFELFLREFFENDVSTWKNFFYLFHYILSII